MVTSAPTHRVPAALRRVHDPGAVESSMPMMRAFSQGWPGAGPMQAANAPDPVHASTVSGRGDCAVAQAKMASVSGRGTNTRSRHAAPQAQTAYSPDEMLQRRPPRTSGDDSARGARRRAARAVAYRGLCPLGERPAAQRRNAPVDPRFGQ